MDRKTLELLGWEFQDEGHGNIILYSHSQSRSVNLHPMSIEEGLKSDRVIEFIRHYYINLEAKLDHCERIALELGAEFGWDGYR